MNASVLAIAAGIDPERTALARIQSAQSEVKKLRRVRRAGRASRDQARIVRDD